MVHQKKKLICFQNYLDVMVKSALNWRLGPYDNHVAAQLAQMMCLPWSNTRLKLEIKAIWWRYDDHQMKSGWWPQTIKMICYSENIWFVWYTSSKNGDRVGARASVHTAPKNPYWKKYIIKISMIGGSINPAGQNGSIDSYFLPGYHITFHQFYTRLQ